MEIFMWILFMTKERCALSCTSTFHKSLLYLFWSVIDYQVVPSVRRTFQVAVVVGPTEYTRVCIQVAAVINRQESNCACSCTTQFKNMKRLNSRSYYRTHFTNDGHHLYWSAAHSFVLPLRNHGLSYLYTYKELWSRKCLWYSLKGSFLLHSFSIQNVNYCLFAVILLLLNELREHIIYRHCTFYLWLLI